MAPGRRGRASASRTPRPTRGSGCGTAASTRWCGRTWATSGPASSWPGRAGRPGRRRVRAAHPLRRRAGPARAFWGRPGTSSITQPPMYGHAVARWSAAAGLPLSERWWRGRRAGCASCCSAVGARRAGWWSCATRGSRGATTARAGTAVLDEPWTATGWWEAKGRLLGPIERTPGGAPLANPAFAVGSVGLLRAGGVERARAGRRHRRRRTSSAGPTSSPRRSTRGGTPSCGPGSTTARRRAPRAGCARTTRCCRSS